jgi:beta-ribofuranosylaminobenzene 5'-phosphate synthase
MRHDPLPSTRWPTAVEIHTPARLHLGMLSFGVPDIRAYGGVGVMIDRPGVHLRMTCGRPATGDRFHATGPLADRAAAFARACADAWRLEDDAACTIEVVQVPGSHAGLGSGTQLGLAIAAGMRQLFRPTATQAGPNGAIRFDTSDAVELARAVGRGRRSCVGVYGFSGGGLIIEGGRHVPANRGREDDASRPFSPLLARVQLPAAWRCVVFGMRDAVGLHGDAEKQAFASLPPVPREISAELSRIAVMELWPAAVEGQFVEFSDALLRYGLLAGKPFEQASSVLSYAESTAHLIESLQGLGVRGCAQSSWGPTVMACCESADAADSLVERFATTELARQYDPLIARFDSQGAEVREIDANQALATGSP